MKIVLLVLTIMMISAVLYFIGQAEWAYVIQLLAFSVAMFDNANKQNNK